MSTSPEHEIVKGNIGSLVEDYLLNLGQEFVSTGSFSQEREAVASVQADESYCFGAKKLVPDLAIELCSRCAIEVVITSGGFSRIELYKALGVKEVWFWEDGVIEVYNLDGDEYRKLPQSQWVPEMDLRRLADCAAVESRVQAVRAFRGK